MGAHERALVLLLFSAASTGLIYVSSVYSQALKDTLDLSQDDIETISLSCYLGGLFGFLPGRVSDVMGTRRTIVFGGGAQGLLLFVFWLVAKKLVVVPAPLPLLCVLTFLQYLSSGCTVAAVFSALSRLYGENRGVVVGMGKAYVGMVGAIVTQIYHGIVPSASDGAAVDFILVTGLASLALCWIPALLLDADELREPHGGGPAAARVGVVLAVVVATIACCTTSALADPRGAARSALAAAVGALLFAPALTLLLPDDKAPPPLGDALCAPAKHPRGMRTAEMLRTVEAWLLLYVVVTIVGTGLVVSTNGAQMAAAARVSGGGALVVTLFSGAQGLSRIGGGAATDALRRRGVPLQVALVVAALLGAAAHGLMWLSKPAFFEVGVVLAGFAFGIVWPLMVVLVRDLFGDEHFGSNYMVYDGGSSCGGALLFAKLLVASSYNAHKVPLDDDDAPGDTCVGAKCFPYVAVAALNLVAAGAALLLSFGPLAPTPLADRRDDAADDAAGDYAAVRLGDEPPGDRDEGDKKVN